jgi:hypothetical protein
MFTKFKHVVKSLLSRFLFSVRIQHNEQVAQVIISNQYLLMKESFSPKKLPSFSNVGFQVYSQFEEDGILLFIFSIIGTINKRVVEICASDGKECMAANLIINHGWEGLLFDGDKTCVERGIDFFKSNKSTFLFSPVFVHAWLTKDNINNLIAENGFSGDIDLLSLDIDGNDYYIMEAIDVIKPRVIICETNNVVPSDLSLPIPYDPNFNRFSSYHPDFMSVSLLAMNKLLNRKGYRLIGSHRFGFNAIYMLNNIGLDYFPEVSIESSL